MAVQSSLKLDSDSVFDGTYEVLHAVGRGKNSVVYKARKIQGAFSGQLVALKVLVEDTKDPSLHFRRMKREALAMLSSIHPNVVKLTDYVASENNCYLSMEFAERGDLRLLLESQRMVFTPELVLRLMVQVLGGLEAIHRVGIIHRDIKPENLLLTADCKIKIADFGIACLPTEQVSKEEANRGIGTFDYLSPESLEDGVSDESTDVYSTAVTCYQLLTGSLPFAGLSFTEQITNKMEGRVLPLASFIGDVPSLLQNFVNESLAANPGERHQTAGDFRKSIEMFLAGSWEPKVARADRQRHLETVRELDQSNTAEETALFAEARKEPTEPRSPEKANPPQRSSRYLQPQPEPLASAFLDESLDDDEEETQRKPMAKRLLVALLVGLLAGGVWASVQPRIGQILEIGTGDLVRKEVSSEEQPKAELVVSKKTPPQATIPLATPPTEKPQESGPDFSVISSAQHAGRIYGLIDSQTKKHTSFVTLPSQNQQGIFIILALQGWQPVFVSDEELKSSSSVPIKGAGMELILRSEQVSSESGHTLGGTYTDIRTGRSGRWFLW